MNSSAEQILEGLDDAQRSAAQSVEGPVRIIACAGAGKTRTITRRIAYACATGAWEASQSLAVTFSVKAAQEMRVRLLDLGVGEHMRISTFHAAALRQLRGAWGQICEGPFPHLVDKPSELVATALFRACNKECEKQMVQDVKSEIDWCKVSLVVPEEYEHVCSVTHRIPPAQLEPEQFIQMYKQYELEKSARLEIDFNDILLMTAHVIEAFPDIAHDIREHIGWLTVDEYQDVSPLQHRLMTQWLGNNRNICVVGDPAQTIYSFAGATSYYLTHFAHEFAPIAADIALHIDYRSTPQIVTRANAVLKKSPNRNEYLQLQAAKDDGLRVSSKIYETDELEARDIVARIAQIITQGGKPADCAILTRINAQQHIVVQALQEAEIPYQIRRDSGWQQSALQEVAVITSAMPENLEEAQRGRVTVSTIHASKGLEFKHVFLLGLSEGLLPYHASDDMEHTEEERRVLYVGVTRAEDTLHLSYAKRQDESSSRVRALSRFLQ